tara:strand:+ start:75 stop:665 length:591 start_codon:yes stop_codon:yes gene_type:complete
MRTLYNFIIEPIGDRYNNTKKIGDKELILNTEIFNHQYVNREAKVIALPKLLHTDIRVGDTVLVHHNIFRRWHDVKGVEKNSRDYIGSNLYSANQDQMFAYKKNNKWRALSGYCFVQPIESSDIFNINKEKPLVGVIKYISDDIDNIKVNDTVGFIPGSEYEFILSGKRLYRVLTKFITIKYEYKGDEKEYNPSWA